MFSVRTISVTHPRHKRLDCTKLIVFTLGKKRSQSVQNLSKVELYQESVES
jgi:hypothetical protein